MEARLILLFLRQSVAQVISIRLDAGLEWHARPPAKMTRRIGEHQRAQKIIVGRVALHHADPRLWQQRADETRDLVQCPPDAVGNVESPSSG